MIEMRWLTWEDEEYPQIPTHEIQFGRKYDKVRVTKKKLQYRQQYNATVYAGMPGKDFMNRTAKTVWSDWKDVPEVADE